MTAAEWRRFAAVGGLRQFQRRVPVIAEEPVCAAPSRDGSDPIVFGIPLERHEVYAVDAARTTTCYPCGVKWATDWAEGTARCWCCGSTAARYVNPLND